MVHLRDLARLEFPLSAANVSLEKKKIRTIQFNTFLVIKAVICKSSETSTAAFIGPTDLGSNFINETLQWRVELNNEAT